MHKKKPFVLTVSIILGTLISLISLSGILIPDFYSRETANWQAQSIGQDMVDLFVIVPCLIIPGIFAYRGSKKAMLLWGGVLCYLIYTFIIYCFAIHFNRLFVLYCTTLGLSFYSLIYFFIQWNRQEVQVKSITLTNIIAVYFLFISTMFYCMWLAEIMSGVINNTIPSSLDDVGLVTNPVHVLDLSIFLPALFITSVLLFKKKSLGFILAPVLLVFTILMNITIGALQVIMVQRNVESGYGVLIIMSVLAVFNMILLFYYFKSMQTVQMDKPIVTIT